MSQNLFFGLCHAILSNHGYVPKPVLWAFCTLKTHGYVPNLFFGLFAHLKHTVMYQPGSLGFLHT
jgi:hypothetical protein